VIKDPAN